MPARNSSMELSSPSNHEADATSQPNRRKSGRVSRKPQALGFENEDVDMAQTDSDEEPDSSDQDQAREKKRKANRATSSTSKRPKLNGNTTSLAIRPAGASRFKRPRTAPRRSDADGDNGLYGQIFGGSKPVDESVMEWLSRFRDNEAMALAEVVNFTLRCTGFLNEVDNHDIEDPDHATSKLQDLQDEYQASKITEYPLIAKGKSSASVRTGIVSFFSSLIKTVASADEEILFTQPEFLENVEVWIAALSSATNRPFRHTATVVTLAIIQALCETAVSLSESHAMALRQKEAEAKLKKKANKGRLSELGTRADALAEKMKKADDMISDWFDTVVVHRYRDIDPRIRGECLSSLTDWITVHPDHFLNGEHLRYVGWMLVDPTAQIRLDILKGLKKIYKSVKDLAGIQQFTDRFRSRLVEMATQDAEVNVRAASIELLDLLREKELLEPDDIDTVGGLLYDAEPKVRAAVAGFFVASLTEIFDSNVEDLGDAEQIEEEFPAPDADDFESPRLDWLKYKCLAQMMSSYDAQDSSKESTIRHDMTFEEAALSSRGESRYSFAALAILEKFDVIAEWESLAGYLLSDNSGGNPSGDLEARLKHQCQLDEGEEVILLDVLNASVAQSLSEVAQEGGVNKAKKTKAQLRELQETQEAAAQRLAAIIPRLLNKYGESPVTVASVLQLARVLNLEVFQELRQDSTVFSSLLDDINKQFLTHEDEHVQAEARAALLYAKSFADLEEITESKLQTLWDDTAYGLIALCHNEALRRRGSLHVTTVSAISSTVSRLASLASISNCTVPYETPRTITQGKNRRRTNAQPAKPTPPIAHLIDLLGRGAPAERINAETDVAENVLVSHAIKACIFYFMWQASSLANSKTSQDRARVAEIADRFNLCSQLLILTITRRRRADELRLTAAGALLDLHTMFCKFYSQQKPSDQLSAFSQLFAPLSGEAQRQILDTFSAIERDYARKASKKVEGPADDEEPEDTSSDDEDDEESEEIEAKHRQGLITEERLCTLGSKIVLSLLAGAVDSGVKEEGPVRKRLLRNRARLGQNFKQVCAFLDTNEAKEKPATRKATNAKSAERIEVDDDVDEDEAADGQEVDEHDEEELRRRGLLGDDDEMEEEDGRNDQEAEVESLLGD